MSNPHIGRRYSMALSPTICSSVFIFPNRDTATWLRAPISAIHSRKAETAISRPIMIAAASAMYHFGSPCTTRTNAVVTISLSATGSRNAPKREVRSSFRARYPSSRKNYHRSRSGPVSWSKQKDSYKHRYRRNSKPGQSNCDIYFL